MGTSSIELLSRRTRRQHAPEFRAQVAQAAFAPLVLPAPDALAPARDIRVALQRRETAIRVAGSVAAAADCAAWPRELLR